MREHIRVTDRDEWLRMRLGHMTASRAKDLLAYDRYGKPKEARTTYIFELAAERLTGLCCTHYISTAMQHGIDMEEVAKKAYMVKTGELVEHGGWWRIPELNVGASPDGLVGEDGLVQFKCPYKMENHLKVMLSNEVPPDHYLQCQWELWVTGRKWSDYASFDERFGNLSLFIIRLEPDEELFEKFEQEARKADEEIREIVSKLTE